MDDATQFLGVSVHAQLIRELHTSIAPTAGEDAEGSDNTRGTMLLEVYALEIQMYGETKNNKKLRVRPLL